MKCYNYIISKRKHRVLCEYKTGLGVGMCFVCFGVYGDFHLRMALPVQASLHFWNVLVLEPGEGGWVGGWSSESKEKATTGETTDLSGIQIVKSRVNHEKEVGFTLGETGRL